MKNQILLKLIFAILVSFLFISCEKDDVLESKDGFPETATNLSLINSKYDDYNSDLEPGEYDMYAFVFSSNRKSMGNNFDLVNYTIYMDYPFEKNTVSIREISGKTTICLGIMEMLSVLNNPQNKYGPYIHKYNITNTKYEDSEFIFFYAQGEENNLDIKYMTYERDTSANAKYAYKITGPFDFSAINTSGLSEAYITIVNDEIYYCSNENGVYNLYKKILPQNVDLIEYLQQPNTEIPIPIEELNSTSDDKCPYITDEFIVFSSNRTGGFGGYDLWYSRKRNGVWEEPQNFGNKINTEFDEYRPIFRKYKDIKNDMMIFSSNRAGGLGGFDLYYVGITETK